MQNYYDRFVQLSLQLCLKEDYADKQKLKAHDKAMTQLDKLQREMAKTDCSRVILALLEHPEERVRMGAAAFCIKIRIYIEKATAVLDNIIDTSNDSTIIFSAEMILKHML